MTPDRASMRKEEPEERGGGRIEREEQSLCILYETLSLILDIYLDIFQ